METDTLMMFIILTMILIIIMLKDSLFHKFLLHKAQRDCSIIVKSKYTGKEYHVSKYRIHDVNGMELRVYSPYAWGYEWYSVWMFEHPRRIMRKLDLNYYNQDYSKYRGSENENKFTDTHKI